MPGRLDASSDDVIIGGAWLDHPSTAGMANFDWGENTDGEPHVPPALIDVADDGMVVLYGSIKSVEPNGS